MVSTPQTLLKIKQIYPSLHGNYRLVADQILENPGLLIQKKVSDVASVCGCDEAQVIRFCQKLGFKGFSELKHAIAHDLIPLKTDVNSENIAEEGSFTHLLEDFRENYLRTVNDTVSIIDEKTIRNAVKLLREANRIIICGQGASGTVGEDFQMKLARMGFNAFRHHDSDVNKMCCSLLTGNDVLFAISFSGENRDVLTYVNVAKESGAKVILVTNYSESSIARKADVVLLTAADETDFRLGAMTSRIAQLMIVDFITVMLAFNDMEKTERNIMKTHSILHKKTGKNK